MVCESEQRVNAAPVLGCWASRISFEERVSQSASDPFSVLGLPARFDLAPADIERAYLLRAARVHPDAHSADDADRTAAELNGARRVLKDPEQRANALLTLLGGPGKEQDKSLPPGFLAEMLAQREQIEEETRTRDPAALARWREWAAASRQRFVEDVTPLFERAHAGDRAVLGQIRALLNAWRYVERLREQMAPEYHAQRADFTS